MIFDKQCHFKKIQMNEFQSSDLTADSKMLQLCVIMGWFGPEGGKNDWNGM